MASLIQGQLSFAILTGLVPSLIWLYFWHHIDRKNKEPMGLLILCFVLGGVSVLLATPLQAFTKNLSSDPTVRIAIWAGIEELLKFIVFYLIAYKSDYDDEAIDPPLYLITVALGFAAVENIFYLMQPTANFNVTATLLTGGMRFFGSSLLHTIASCFVGISISLSSHRLRRFGILIGLAGATFLHTTFNFFILKNDATSFIKTYGYLWVAAIISHVILEKLRRVPLKESTVQPT